LDSGTINYPDVDVLQTEAGLMANQYQIAHLSFPETIKQDLLFKTKEFRKPLYSMQGLNCSQREAACSVASFYKSFREVITSLLDPFKSTKQEINTSIGDFIMINKTKA